MEKRTRSWPSSSNTSRSKAWIDDDRAPVSIFAFTHGTSAWGSATHSRQPTTTFSGSVGWGAGSTGPSWQVAASGQVVG